ncbi:hypothetical protein HanXRQr2_Chr05g0196241 [Helianthus annuus]|uniref:Uncharacterized protein n=1 Tax=Helianthus annuus TaxID=4232 RepID=A0A9K3IWB7_HELAN|nr:hypothetical protein HanXRQr2_Chr05g0196241 [Helianthus annuus]KAJ0921282.1 hypothetical protein HanPSC8_Chr05g0189681 [Helianthus annuus]
MIPQIHKNHLPIYKKKLNFEKRISSFWRNRLIREEQTQNDRVWVCGRGIEFLRKLGFRSIL